MEINQPILIFLKVNAFICCWMPQVVCIIQSSFNTLNSVQNGWHFANNTFQVCISTRDLFFLVAPSHYLTTIHQVPGHHMGLASLWSWQPKFNSPHGLIMISPDLLVTLKIIWLTGCLYHYICRLSSLVPGHLHMQWWQSSYPLYIGN